MTNKARRRCRSTCSARPQPAGVGTPALLPFRRSNVQGLVWLGVSAAVASALLSRVEAFLQPLAGGMGGPVGVKGHRSAWRERTAARGICSMSERRGLWPSRPTIDLRSDTVTQPTGGMRKAMHKAEVGDDVLGEDPTVKRLEAETAEILGKEAALFVPSGTMANLICHLVWCSQRGSEMILGDQCHSFLWEQANAAQFGGIGYRPLSNLPDGTIDLNEIEAAVRGNNPCFPVSRLVTIENTHAQCGGKVLPMDYLDDLAQLAQEEGLRVHMDGARLWNAAAASRLPLSRIVAGVDSVSVCYSKGLGAPVGSAVAGSADFIRRAHRVRKALGGGMRQSGVVAAAALEGLRKQLPRLGEDHVNAKRLAQGFYNLGMPNAVDVDPTSVHSNIVLAHIGADLTDEGMTASVVCNRLREKGVLAMSITPGTIRFVTHSQVSTTDIQRTVTMVKEILEEAGLRPLGRAQLPAFEDVIAGEDFDVRSTRNNEAEATAQEYLNSVNSEENASFTNQREPGIDARGGAVETPAAGDVTAAEVPSVVSAESAEQRDSVIGDGTVTAGVDEEDVSGLGLGDDVSREGGVLSEDEEGAEGVDDAPPFHNVQFEEVELQGMAVSNEGFVAILTSKESQRALKLLITPDDPMSGGLDVEQAETSEARTLLQLIQGIDVARHLPHDALGNLMDLSMRTGVELNTAYISDAKPFSATLTAKVPQRDGEALTSTPPVSGGDSSQAASTAADGDDGGESNPDDDWTDGGAAAAQAAAAAATAADLEMTREPTEGERPVGSWSGRPRVGVSKVAITTSAFEALGLALRYPSTRIFVRSELLAGGDGAGRGAAKGKGSGTWSFDSADVADLYPNLMKLEDAKARRSAADDIDAQFEVQKLRQQLESAMNAGDSDRVSVLREELNSLRVPDADTAAVQ